MEINFNTVKALSSPTRVRILNQILKNESTPTKLSNELDKSKSTVSSHLSTLQKAELIEKNAEEGRRRVTYAPTSKAEAIIEGKERKVKFSFGSTAISALAGITIGAYSLMPRFGETAQDSASSSVGTMSNMAVESSDAGSKAANNASGIDLSSLTFSSEIILGVGLFFFGIAITSFIYGWTVNKLGE